MKHFSYLQRCLPIAQRKLMKFKGMDTKNIIWAFHSESEEELLNMIPCVSKGAPTWPDLRELGVGWWITNNTILKRLFEKVAKASFQAKNDPLDAAIFYLAMKKKTLVWGLYRSVGDERMTTFFKNNFAEDRWRKAALKNAFALMGKQRFAHAAAFFLLSGSVKDAINICVNELKDIQLAMVISRLYDGETCPVPESLKSLLHKHVLGAKTTEEQGDKVVLDSTKAHPDPFLRSIALWMIKDYSGSLSTLVKRNVGHDHPEFNEDEALALSRKKVDADPSVFNFYIYLRTHPLITRHNIASKKESGEAATLMLSGFRRTDSVAGASAGATGSAAAGVADAVTHLERRLYFSTAHFYLRSGCPALAVEVLSKLPNRVVDGSGSGSTTEKSSRQQSRAGDVKIETGTFEDAKASGLDWSQPVPKDKKPAPGETGSDALTSAAAGGASDVIDWSSPLVSAPPKEDDDDELKLEWSDDPGLVTNSILFC